MNRDQTLEAGTAIRRPRRTSMLLLGAIISLGALVWISLSIWTAPLGLMWHFFHGHSASFEGHRVDVPWDMWVSRSTPGVLLMVRHTPKYPLLQSPSAIFL